MAVAEVIDVDLLNPSHYRNGMPHALYADLREIGSAADRRRGDSAVVEPCDVLRAHGDP
jgi:hypothetical protein